MCSTTNLKCRKSATTDKKEASTYEGDLFLIEDEQQSRPTVVARDTHTRGDESLAEDELQSYVVTSSAAKTGTAQQKPTFVVRDVPVRLVLLVVVLIVFVGAICMYMYQCKLDALEAEKKCAQEKHEAKEKYRSALSDVKEKYRSDLDDAKEKYRSDLDDAKEKYRSDLDDVKEKYRSDLDEVKDNCRSDIDETKEQYRSELGQAKENFREEKEKRINEIEQQNRQLVDQVNWLVSCFAGKHISQLNNNMLSIIFNALKTGLGINRDMEDCLGQFGNRFQQRLLA